MTFSLGVLRHSVLVLSYKVSLASYSLSQLVFLQADFFFRRMIYLLKYPVGSVIFLDHNFFLDLEWWISFLPKWNGTSSFLPISWLLPSVLHLFTDAAKRTGFGAFLNGHWFNGKWPLWV